MGKDNQGFMIRQHFFKNPVVILAQPTPLTFPSGKVGPELLMYYKRLSLLETSVIMAGPASVTGPVNRRFSLLRVDQPKYFEGIHALIKILTGNGSTAGVQLTIPPPTGNPLDWYRSEPIQTLKRDNYPSVHKGLAAFYKACSRCRKAGFGWVELDFTEGAFLNQSWQDMVEDQIVSFFQMCRRSLGKETVFSLRISEGTHLVEPLSSLFLQNHGDILAFSDAVLKKIVPPEKSLTDQPVNLKQSPIPFESLFQGVKPERVFQSL